MMEHWHRTEQACVEVSVWLYEVTRSEYIPGCARRCLGRRRESKGPSEFPEQFPIECPRLPGHSQVDEENKGTDGQTVATDVDQDPTPGIQLEPGEWHKLDPVEVEMGVGPRDPGMEDL